MKRPSLATISSGKTMKIGVDLFVNLKQGSITKYYTIGQVLGQGAFGKVWKVTHKTTGTFIAINPRAGASNETNQKINAN
jgi:calcium-dependent protein kinase